MDWTKRNIKRKEDGPRSFIGHYAVFVCARDRQDAAPARGGSPRLGSAPGRRGRSARPRAETRTRTPGRHGCGTSPRRFSTSGIGTSSTRTRREAEGGDVDADQGRSFSRIRRYGDDGVDARPRAESRAESRDIRS